MEKSVAGLLAVASVFATSAGAAPVVPASIDAAMHASSYADLLQPIPNALALLSSEHATPGAATPDVEQVQLRVYIGPPRPQYYYYNRHHHHHHHHHWRRPYHHHHHHHHHT